MSNKTKQLIVFTTADGKISVNTHFDEETAWLSLEQMAELFARDKSTISRHIKNVFDEGELEPSATVAKFATVQTEGGREVEHTMTMAQWIAELDRQLQGNRSELFTHKGGISKQQAIEKAEKEFETYRAGEMRQLQSDFENTLKQLNTKVGKKT